MERTAEALVDEHRDRRRVRALELRGQRRRVRVRPEVARRRRAALDLGDRSEMRPGESLAEAHQAGTSALCEKAINSSSRDPAAPESTASRASSSPSRRSRACPAAAIAPAELSRTAERRPPLSPAKTALTAAAFSA